MVKQHFHKLLADRTALRPSSVVVCRL